MSNSTETLHDATRIAQSPAKRSLGPLLVATGWMIAIGSVVFHSYATYRIPIEPARDNTPVILVPNATTAERDSTGYPVPCYYTDFDGYYYVSFARKMVEEGTPRVRWTNLDNAPNGRPVHWSSLFSWWLIALGTAHSLVSSYSISSAICAAGYYANPLLFGIVLTILCWTVWRRVSAMASFLMLVALATNPRIAMDFSYARPDHHGLHLVFAMGMVLCVILGCGGWVSSHTKTLGNWPKMSQARKWMIASGILGGCGLWTGATQQSVVILSLGIGAILSMWFGTVPDVQIDSQGRHHATTPQYKPELWRWWSWAGAATSLGSV